MLASFSEFKFYQSFRIPVEKADNLRFLVERDDELGKSVYISDAQLVDLSLTGLGLETKERISVGTELTLSLQFKKRHLDLTGRVVRAFCNSIEDDEIIYGIEIDEEPGMRKFLESFIMSFSAERLKECLIDSALKEKYTKASDGFEMFSLLLSLFKDITQFGDKDGFLENMLEEVVRVMNAERSSIFLINAETNKLEAVGALGIDKEELKFDYRLGIAGSVFTTGMALNIDAVNDTKRFRDKETEGLKETQSVICHPIHNREDKIIGVVEVVNKRNQDRFTVEDEKTMKVLSLMFSSVFHGYNPVSEVSRVRRFSTPFDREFALIGKTTHMGSIRSSIVRVKDLDGPLLIEGEHGVGKQLYAKIVHKEGQRGLRPFNTIDCQIKNYDSLESQLWGDKSQLIASEGGSVLLREIEKLPIAFQERLVEVLKEGSIGEEVLNVRVMASSSVDLSHLVDEGTFDRELYEFLSKAYIHIEPLRRRIDDLELLVDYFLKIECKDQGLLLKSFSPKMIERLKDYDWPGNVKELRKTVSRAVLYNPKAHVISDLELETSASPLVDTAIKQRMFGDLPFVGDFHVTLKDRLAIVEREMILSEIKRSNGNKSKAAKEMGISREALRKKLLISRQVLDQLEEKFPDQKKKAA